MGCAASSPQVGPEDECILESFEPEGPRGDILYGKFVLPDSGGTVYLTFESFADGHFVLLVSNLQSMWSTEDAHTNIKNAPASASTFIAGVRAAVRAGHSDVIRVDMEAPVRVTIFGISGPMTFTLKRLRAEDARRALHDMVSHLFSNSVTHRDFCSSAPQPPPARRPSESRDGTQGSAAPERSADKPLIRMHSAPDSDTMWHSGGASARSMNVRLAPIRAPLPSIHATQQKIRPKRVRSWSASQAESPLVQGLPPRNPSPTTRAPKIGFARRKSAVGIAGPAAVSSLQNIRRKLHDGDTLSPCDMGDLNDVISSLSLINAEPTVSVKNDDSDPVDEETMRFVESELFGNHRSGNPNSESFMAGMYSIIFTQKLKKRIVIKRRESLKGEVQRLNELERFRWWDFDVFSMSAAFHEAPLATTAMAAILMLDLPKAVALQDSALEKLQNFFKAVEAEYNTKNPYHNNVHAADVVHAFFVSIHIGNMQRHFSPFELLAGIIACAAHDVGHPGVNNNFLINTGGSHAVTYNDRSVLENYHACRCFQLMGHPDNDFLQGLETGVKMEFREIVIRMILSTDIGQHFTFLARFQSHFEEDFDASLLEDRLLHLELLIKAADISNATKSIPLYTRWSNLVMAEFYSQGDEERMRNMAVSPFMDRLKPTKYKCQLGFIDYIAKPLFEAMAAFDPSTKCLLAQLHVNRDFLCKSEADGVPYGAWDLDEMQSTQEQQVADVHDLQELFNTSAASQWAGAVSWTPPNPLS